MSSFSLFLSLSSELRVFRLGLAEMTEMTEMGRLGLREMCGCEYSAPGMLKTAAVFDSAEKSRLGDTCTEGELCASSLAAALALAEEAKMFLADLKADRSLLFDALNGPSWKCFLAGEAEGVVDWIVPAVRAKLGFETDCVLLWPPGSGGREGDGMSVVETDF